MAGYTFIDNSDAVMSEMAKRARVALEAVGIQAEGHCKQELSNTPKRIDTGMLRNSITHAVDGKPPAKSSYHGDRANRQGVTPSGSYKGSVPTEDKPAVYVGTNVEYAPYVEYGTDRMEPNHFIKNGVEKNLNEYKGIIKKYMKG